MASVRVLSMAQWLKNYQDHTFFWPAEPANDRLEPRKIGRLLPAKIKPLLTFQKQIIDRRRRFLKSLQRPKTSFLNDFYYVLHNTYILYFVLLFWDRLYWDRCVEFIVMCVLCFLIRCGSFCDLSGMVKEALPVLDAFRWAGCHVGALGPMQLGPPRQIHGLTK